MSAVFFLDGAIALLLVATIIYCWKLSRKITLLHEGRHELNHFIADFNTAITRAESNISQLKDLGNETDEKLREDIQKARFLANDLSFLMDKGENVADALETYITSSRGISNRSDRRDIDAPVFANKSSGSSNKKMGVAQMAKSIKEKRNTGNVSTPEQISSSKKQMLDSVLAQIAARKKKTVEAQPATPVSKNTVPETKGAKEIATPFNERRLKESLEANQNNAVES